MSSVIIHQVPCPIQQVGWMGLAGLKSEDHELRWEQCTEKSNEMRKQTVRVTILRKERVIHMQKCSLPSLTWAPPSILPPPPRHCSLCHAFLTRKDPFSVEETPLPHPQQWHEVVYSNSRSWPCPLLRTAEINCRSWDQDTQFSIGDTPFSTGILSANGALD